MRTSPPTRLARDRALPRRLSDRDPSAPRPRRGDGHDPEHRAIAEPVPGRRMAAMTRTKNVAVYERDPESDAWLVSIKDIPGCHTYGRTLRQAETRIREALALWLDREPEGLEITPRWPAELTTLASEVSQAR